MNANEILNMIGESGGMMGKRALHGTLHQRCGNGCHADVQRLIAEGMIDWQERQGYELGVYLLTDMGKAALTPMPG